MPQTETDTKERILEAAERLYTERGIRASSLRAITAEAGANVAAVNYHFGSKQELLRALIERRVGAANEQRLELLDRLESAPEGRAPSIEEILDAFLRPVFAESRGAGMRSVTALLFAEPLEIKAPLIAEIFGSIQQRFSTALARALPEVPEPVLGQRFPFVIGCMIHMISGHGDIDLPSGGLRESPSADELLGRMIPFLAAGLRAPVSVPVAEKSEEPTP